MSLSLNNASALMDACQSSSFGNAILGYPQPNSAVAGTTSGGPVKTVDANTIAPLATPLFQLPTPTVTNNFSDKVVNVLSCK